MHHLHPISGWAGRISVMGEYVTQVVALENASDKAYRTVEIECGFYNKSNELVGSGSHYVENLRPRSSPW